MLLCSLFWPTLETDNNQEIGSLVPTDQPTYYCNFFHFISTLTLVRTSFFAVFLFRPRSISVVHPVGHFFSYFSYLGGLPSDPRRLPDVPERPSSSATGGGRCTVAEVAPPPPPRPLKVPPPTAGGDVGVPSVADLRLMEPKKSGVPSWGKFN